MDPPKSTFYHFDILKGLQKWVDFWFRNFPVFGGFGTSELFGRPVLTNLGCLRTSKNPLFEALLRKSGSPMLEINFYFSKSGQKGVTGFTRKWRFSSFLGFLGYPVFHHIFITLFNIRVIIYRRQFTLITVYILCPFLDQKGVIFRSFWGPQNTPFLDT